MRLIVALIPLTTLLAACTEEQIAISCPQLANPPKTVVVALQKAGAGDQKARAWVIKLAKHYEKQGLCKKGTAASLK